MEEPRPRERRDEGSGVVRLESGGQLREVSTLGDLKHRSPEAEACLR